jgi:hypothetical protein
MLVIDRLRLRSREGSWMAGNVVTALDGLS